jgi:hypothetical protein
MKREALAFGTAFGVSVLIGFVASGCASNTCECPPRRLRPEPQSALPDLHVLNADESGNFAVSPVRPEGGTLEVTGDSVIIQYAQDGVAHRVVYEVVSPR